MNITKICCIAIVMYGLVLCCTSVSASSKVSGSFTSTRACDAFQSFRKGTNPGAIRTIPGTTYEAREVNSVNDYSWIRIVVPDLDFSERWVAIECGVSRIETTPVDTDTEHQTKCQIPNDFDNYVLAITWQPGFCEHFQYNGRKPECDAMESGEISIANLTLHGLWPNKNGCDKSYGHCGGDPLSLSDETISKIAPWMPNFFYESAFGSYEWRKHGVCQERDDDTYFLMAVELVKIVDSSKLGAYIHESIGGNASIKKIFEIVQAETVTPVNNMTILCSNGRYLQEIRFGLSKDFNYENGLGELLQNGPVLKRVIGCSGDELKIERSGVN